MKNKILIIFLGILLIGNLSALGIEIQTKDSFIQGEELYFDYQIISDTVQEITFIPQIFCNKNPIVPLQEEKVLIEGVYLGTYSDFVVDEDILQDICTASITITSPVNLKQEKSFAIDVKPELEFNILTCKDSYCNEKSKVFLRGEDIFVKTDNDLVSMNDLTGEIILSNGEKQSLDFSRDVSETSLNKKGSYEIELVFANEHYKRTAKKTQIAIIDKVPEIGEVRENVFASPEIKERSAWNLIKKLVEKILNLF